MTQNNKCHELWQEFLALMDYKARQDCYFNDLNDSIKRVKTILAKEKEDYRKTLILEELINFISKKIEHKATAKEVFNSVPTHAYDVRKELRKNKHLFEDLTIHKIEEFHDGLENCSRKELHEYEEFYNNKLKENSKVFGQKQARGQIVGALNKGMYGYTKEEIINTINYCGGKLRNNDRLIDYMDHDLIKFRIIGLRIASKYCEKSVEKRIQETGTDILDETCYETMLKKTENLGKILKEIYEEENCVTPLEEITINLLGPDTKALDMFFDEDKKVKKHK